MSTYSDLVLKLGPSVYYPFDEISGTVARDVSGHGSDGAYVGAPLLGAFGGLAFDNDTAVELNGTSQYVTTPYATRTNLILNPSFEVGVAPWADGGSGVTVNRFAQDGGWANSGRYSARYTATNSTGSAKDAFIFTPSGVGGMAVTAGTTYNVAAVVNVLQAAGTGTQIGFWWYTAAGAFISASYSAGQLGTGLNTVGFSAVAPATAAFASVLFFPAAGMVNLGVVDVFVDAVIMSAGPTTPYFDGSTAGGSWTGAAHNSASMTGPFAIGSQRTFAGMANRRVNTADHSLFGGDAGNPPRLFIASGTNDVYWNSAQNDGAGAAAVWATAWPGTALWVPWALTVNDVSQAEELFIAGQSKGVVAHAHEYSAAGAGNLRIGHHTAMPFDGLVDEFCAFERLLSPGEILSMAKAATAGAGHGIGVRS